MPWRLPTSPGAWTLGRKDRAERAGRDLGQRIVRNFDAARDGLDPGSFGDSSAAGVFQFIPIANLNLGWRVRPCSN
jgi:hypothetical protein